MEKAQMDSLATIHHTKTANYMKAHENPLYFTSFVGEIKVDALSGHAQVIMEWIFS